MNKSKFEGSCLCGSVKFEIVGEFESFFLCHCSRCRQISGSAHGANLFSKVAKLTILQGKENIKDFYVKESRFSTTFCSECGSKIPKDHGGKILQVPAGAIQTDINIKPNAHIFCGSKANWDENLENIPGFDQFPH
ncbi:GFA family protein [Bacteriovoracaceae bacterium]|nr:GFA family protein [Bacteriovoracaceae bacterium]